jgi:hypothetical protein
MHSQRLVG